MRDKCDCAICKHQQDFNVPKELLEDLMSGKMVLFTGAGISTESRNVLKYTFYDEVAMELRELGCKIEFPGLMEKYCNQVNGRIRLLSKIRNRLKHIESFPEMKRVATYFHNELSTMYPIKTIITTNWDTYLRIYVMQYLSSQIRIWSFGKMMNVRS